MNVEFDYSTYTLKFRQPFVTSQKVFSERRGLILTLHSESKINSKGDVAPLHEFGSESIEEDLYFLKNFPQPVKFDVVEPLNSIREICNNFEGYPALRSGFEQALVDLACQALGTDIPGLLNKRMESSVMVNGLIGILPPSEAANQALRLVNNGFTTIKIKMGRTDFNEDLSCIKEIRSKIGKEIKIRIDPNGKWTLDEAKRNLELLSQFDIEFAEQPVLQTDDLMALSGEVSVPIAADESVRNKNIAETILKNSSIAVLVLKPCLIGGLLPALEIEELANKYGKGIVISSAFESAIGRRYLFYIASLVKSSLAHGLSTGNLFVSDTEEEAYTLSGGRMKLIAQS